MFWMDTKKAGWMLSQVQITLVLLHTPSSWRQKKRVHVEELQISARMAKFKKENERENDWYEKNKGWVLKKT